MKTKDIFQALMADTLVDNSISKDESTKVVTTMRVYLKRWEARLTKFGLDFDSQCVMHEYSFVNSTLTVRLVSRSSAEFQEFVNSRSVLDYNVVIKSNPNDSPDYLLDSIDAT